MMRLRLLVIIFILTFLLNGCNKAEDNSYQLDYFEVIKVKVDNLHLDNSCKIFEEKRIDNGVSVFLYKDNENHQINGGISLKDKFYDLGEVSVDNTPDDLMGIEEVQVFGKKAVKIYGILGANYAQAFYLLVEENLEESILQESIIQIEGYTVEIDLDEDGKKEIVSTLGTIPETKIFTFKNGTIYGSDINKSIGAKSVLLQDNDKKLFQVYFESNKPEQYVYHEGSLLKK
ncbi:conserved hypothetical protein [Desulfitobacterium hafniense DCB-2]|nr:hypothetical protein [Desulfitobacterium hafniense]ACL22254.1 conserved hypothetical protein [Desulfitobacterium hafniense DCB-2]